MPSGQKRHGGGQASDLCDSRRWGHQYHLR